ncbi:cell division control protein 45 [Thecamonas trahens ATCC 50062]|uniref:Cell division control protein 45 n=1 Tax=Thecamonas trahens ATCC 50062 TaxID=461836 RepID=A0A0L0DEQ5_THETB|nr:cell division control protein 45 [Thecamonas trahens ATCC 50062]KNC50812.1 cell division control protein 45 [Thecamonas trahens ATCC 50062]|eukprot:XP_013756767.1 cell division control protein 45 [Thecamonas trahens ATCC 50062]
MSRDAKHVLETRIHDAAAEFGLPNVAYESFQLKHIYSLPLTASDLVYATTALLEVPAKSSPGAESVIAGVAAAAPEVLRAASRSSSEMQANFWAAYDALHLRNEAKLKLGLDHAIDVQRAIVRQGTSLIESRAIVPSGPFRYAFITDSPDLPYFVHPLALTKLANFLVDTLREAGKAPKPFVMAALNKDADSYLVVGVSGAARFGSVAKNTFGQAFVAAADATQVSAKFDCFESSFVDVKREDMTNFLEHLHHDLFA